jgi:signal peptidase
MSAQVAGPRAGDRDALATTRRDALAAVRREAVAASRARTRPRRSAGVVVRDAVLTLTGIAGALVIAWTIASRVLGLSLVVLMTGSMAPTLPTGSAAVTLDDVPAAELRVGDVVKVPRPGYDLPVTHRIVSVGPVTGEVEELSAGVDPADAAARQLVLQGDANQTTDPSPYVVTAADRVVAGAPLLGYANRLLHTPLVLAGLAGALLLLIVGTSWPSSPPRGDRAGGSTPDRVGRHSASAPVRPDPVPAPAHGRRSARVPDRRPARHAR